MRKLRWEYELYIIHETESKFVSVVMGAFYSYQSICLLINLAEATADKTPVTITTPVYLDDIYQIIYVDLRDTVTPPYSSPWEGRRTYVFTNKSVPFAWITQV